MSALDEELAALEAEDQEAEGALDKARAEQSKVDRIAYLKLKKAQPELTLRSLKLDVYRPGSVTLLVYRSLDKIAHGRFVELSSSGSKGKREQAIRCAVSDCLLYPSEADFAALVRGGEFHELPASLAVAALNLTRAGAAEEGKG